MAAVAAQPHKDLDPEQIRACVSSWLQRDEELYVVVSANNSIDDVSTRRVPLYRLPTKKDGNCFFHALQQNTQGRYGTAVALREDLALYLLQLWFGSEYTFTVIPLDFARAHAIQKARGDSLVRALLVDYCTVSEESEDLTAEDPGFPQFCERLMLYTLTLRCDGVFVDYKLCSLLAANRYGIRVQPYIVNTITLKPEPEVDVIQPLHGELPSVALPIFRFLYYFFNQHFESLTPDYSWQSNTIQNQRRRLNPSTHSQLRQSPLLSKKQLHFSRPMSSQACLAPRLQPAVDPAAIPFPHTSPAETVKLPVSAPCVRMPILVFRAQPELLQEMLTVPNPAASPWDKSGICQLFCTEPVDLRRAYMGVTQKRPNNLPGSYFNLQSVSLNSKSREASLPLARLCFHAHLAHKRSHTHNPRVDSCPKREYWFAVIRYLQRDKIVNTIVGRRATTRPGPLYFYLPAEVQAQSFCQVIFMLAKTTTKILEQMATPRERLL